MLTVSGDVPRVDGQLAVARAFGDKSLKLHLSSEPDVEVKMVDETIEFMILASDGIWKVSTILNLSTKHLLKTFISTRVFINGYSFFSSTRNVEGVFISGYSFFRILGTLERHS